MKKRVLGRTGIEVSEVGLGGVFTSSLGPGFAESRRAVRRAIELGVNYIDTAPGYADSEAVLGRILADVDAPLVISTKLGGRPRPFDPRDGDALLASARESLKLLRRDVIDMLLIHEPDRPGQHDWWSEPAEVYGPVIEVLDQLKRDGLVRFTGVGGTTATELAHVIRSGRFDVVLTAFNYGLLFREAANEVLPAAREHGMGVIAGSVLQQGGLGRRHDEIVRAKPPWLAEPRRRQLLALYDLLDELGMDIVEAGLRFAISNPEIHCVLIGAKTAEQIEASIAAVERGPLPTEVRRPLDEIAAMVPFRPFEEPMLLPFRNPRYRGPGRANHGE